MRWLRKMPKIFDELKELLLLAERVKTMNSKLDSIEKKLDKIDEKILENRERLVVVENNYSHLRNSVKNEILGEIKGDIESTRAKISIFEDLISNYPGLPSKNPSAKS